MWYFRTISKYVEPPVGVPAVKGYEMYTKTRDLTASARWEDFLARKAVICGPPDYVTEELAQAQQKYGFTDLLCWTREGLPPPPGPRAPRAPRFSMRASPPYALEK